MTNCSGSFEGVFLQVDDRNGLGLFSKGYCNIGATHVTGIVMLDISFIALDQSPIVSAPIEASLDLASKAVAGASADRSSMLGSTHERRNRRFDAPPVRELEEGSAVIGLIRDRIPRPCTRVTSLLWHLDRRQYWLGQHAFARLRAIYMQPSRRATAVDNSHKVGAFAHFGFANSKVPFCAGTKRPSTQACAHSNLAWAFNRPTTPAKSALTSQAWTKDRSVASRLQVSSLRVAHFPERI
jgi:hypothetical protein